MPPRGVLSLRQNSTAAMETPEPPPIAPGRPAKHWTGRILDGLAILVIAFAVFKFVIAPRLLAGSNAVRAPQVHLSALTGPEFSLEAHRGRLVFLDFWASWCEPCKLSLPLVEHYAKTHPDVDVIAIDVGEPPPVARGFAVAHDMRNVAFDPDQIAGHAFGVDNFPTLVVVDPDGFERAKWIGFNPAIESAMENARSTYVVKKAAASMIAPAQAAEAQQPFTLAVEEDPSSLNTIRNTPYGWQLAPLTQGYLFLVDDRGALVPDAAREIPTRANGGISADGRTITYRIRTGRWSDGAPFDARDVAFTIDALRNPRTSVPDRSTVDRILAVHVPRRDTLVVTLKEPSAPFVTSFLTLGASDPFAILPKHVVGSLVSLDRSPLDTQTVGLGPFQLRTWRRGDRLDFARNPYYWRGPAALDGVRVLVVPAPQTRLVLARTGQIDATYLAGAQVDALRGMPTLRIATATTNIVDYVQFNLARPTFADARVRRAVARAIDRPRIAQTVYRGLEEPTDSDQLDARYRSGHTLPRADAKAARAQLGGRALQVELAIAGTWRSSDAAAVQIVDQLGRAGITATIKSYAPGTFWGAKDAGGILESGKYDLALTSWSPSLDPDRSYLFGCAAKPPGGGNSMGYCSADFDRDERNGAATYDDAQRQTWYKRAGDRLQADLPVLPLGFERSAYALSARTRNFRPNVLGRDYWNAWELALNGP
jgi:peptide/nickel transport system substrate-binding protein